MKVKFFKFKERLVIDSERAKRALENLKSVIPKKRDRKKDVNLDLLYAYELRRALPTELVNINNLNEQEKIELYVDEDLRNGHFDSNFLKNINQNNDLETWIHIAEHYRSISFHLYGQIVDYARESAQISYLFIETNLDTYGTPIVTGLNPPRAHVTQIKKLLKFTKKSKDPLRAKIEEYARARKKELMQEKGVTDKKANRIIADEILAIKQFKDYFEALSKNSRQKIMQLPKSGNFDKSR